MGCGASASAGQLKEARQQVDELQQRLRESEVEKGELRRCLLASSQREAPAQPEPGGAAECPRLRLDTAPSPEGQDEPFPEPPGAAAQAEALPASAEAPGLAGPGDPAAAPLGGHGCTPKGASGGEAPAQDPLKAAVALLGGKGWEQQEEEEGPAEEQEGAEAAALPGAVPWDALVEKESSQAPCLEELPQAQESQSIVSVSAVTTEDNLERMTHREWQQQVPADPLGQQPLQLKPLALAPLRTPEEEDEEEEEEQGEVLGLMKGGEASDGKLNGSVNSTASTCTPQAGAFGVSGLCHQCGLEGLDLYLDPSDLNRYCSPCWAEYYGQTPPRHEAQALVVVEVAELWMEDRLAQLWAQHCLPGWPPAVVHASPAASSSGEGEVWSAVNVRVRREIVGPHAREQCSGDGHPYSGEILGGRYRVQHSVGEGHFTKAFMAEDLQEGGSVCLKRHRNLSVEALADLMALGHRIADEDPGGQLFPRLLDSFYDVVGYTVESLLEGRNCLSLAQADAAFFRNLGNLRHVAVGALGGLAVLDTAGVVHNDVKPDNLIWTEVEVPGDEGGARRPFVKIVDFGCARLDMNAEPAGRNWSLAEGGAGHLGKWSPEMALRLPIGHRGDVWGTAISLCELHCGRSVWRNESDTAEVVLAQSLGLCGLTDGLPASLLRRSPLDVRQLYTPAPRHFPLRQNALGQLEALRPARWGLEQVLGENWRENEKAEFGELLEKALVVDPALRPSAAELLERCRFVAAAAAGAA